MVKTLTPRISIRLDQEIKRFQGMMGKRLGSPVSFTRASDTVATVLKDINIDKFMFERDKRRKQNVKAEFEFRI